MRAWVVGDVWCFGVLLLLEWLLALILLLSFSNSRISSFCQDRQSDYSLCWLRLPGA